MVPLLTSEQSRTADRYTIEKLGIAEAILIEHAAISALDRLRARFGSLLLRMRIALFVGPGNNGADGLALARLLYLSGCESLSIFSAGGKESPGNRAQKTILKRLNLSVRTNIPRSIDYDIAIDALFGTGLKRPLEEGALAAVAFMNAHRERWTLALDIPSGLDSDTGLPLGECVMASETVTFGFHKRGLSTGRAADFTGPIAFAPLQIPRTIPGISAGSFLFTREDVILPERNPTSHKGTFGHVHIVSGEAAKEGASAMVAMGALRMGAGLATIVGEKSLLASLRPRLIPEIMTAEWKEDFLSTPRNLVVGPGLGLGEPQWRRLEACLRSPSNLVVDADGITLLSEKGQEGTALCKKRVGALILTPHPKEAARLLQCSIEEIERDRFLAAQTISKKFCATCLLKGKGSVIASIDAKTTLVVSSGTTALAKGGSGDLLSGMIAALLGQGLSARMAAANAAYLHGRAAEILSQSRGEEYSALTSEIASFLPVAIAECVF